MRLQRTRGPAVGMDYLARGTELEVNTNRLALVVLVIDAHSVAGENHIVEAKGRSDPAVEFLLPVGRDGLASCEVHALAIASHSSVARRDECFGCAAFEKRPKPRVIIKRPWSIFPEQTEIPTLS